MRHRWWIVQWLMLALTVLMMARASSSDTSASKEEGVPTRVLVRAVSRDAKIIGTKVGGAQIRIRNVRTGEVLAEGKQMGGTGDTQRIMHPLTITWPPILYTDYGFKNFRSWIEVGAG